MSKGGDIIIRNKRIVQFSQIMILLEVNAVFIPPLYGQIKSKYGNFDLIYASHHDLLHTVMSMLNEAYASVYHNFHWLLR
jgi:hypothetical protein